ncbi:MAG: ATP-binding protein [Pseudomonadota bacterium]
MRQTFRFLPILGYLLAVLAVVAAAYQFSYRTALDQLARTGLVRMEQAADRLLGQLESYRQLPNLLTRHPLALAALEEVSERDEVNEFLLRQALLSGADDIYILDEEGVVIATSNFEERHSFIGNAYGFRPDFKTAISGGLGFYHAVEAADGTRDFFYTRGIVDGPRGTVGAVVVKIDVALLEFEWRIDEDVVGFADADGVIFASNRPGLILRQLGTIDKSASTGIARRYPADTLRAFPAYSASERFGHQLWQFKRAGSLPDTALAQTRFVPQLNMTTLLFLNTAPARETARLQSIVAGALMGLLGLGLLFLAQRRTALAERLALEEAATTKLEARVTERTAQLQQAQDDLVQAGKLSALGQLSAGISHELNQPLAAIQNFAANGRKLIDRGRHSDAAQNLGHIIDQTDRITRIIRNLRAFARKETVSIDTVDAQKVVRDALALVEPQLRDHGVTLRRIGPDGPLPVMGGEVRLQQVIVNLITNAIDAMSDAAAKHIEIELAQDRERLFLSLRDTGTGLSDPARVFEPFYSTKEVGASKGLGLGLSISYGIIGSFGGDIVARNRPGGGAEFVISLVRASVEDAA